MLLRRLKNLAPSFFDQNDQKCHVSESIWKVHRQRTSLIYFTLNMNVWEAKCTCYSRKGNLWSLAASMLFEQFLWHSMLIICEPVFHGKRERIKSFCVLAQKHCRDVRRKQLVHLTSQVRAKRGDWFSVWNQIFLLKENYDYLLGNSMHVQMLLASFCVKYCGQIENLLKCKPFSCFWQMWQRVKYCAKVSFTTVETRRNRRRSEPVVHTIRPSIFLIFDGLHFVKNSFIPQRPVWIIAQYFVRLEAWCHKVFMHKKEIQWKQISIWQWKSSVA